MSVMIQIRNVPESVHWTLKARSALAGKSLSDLILDEIVALAALPSTAEIKQRLSVAEPFRMRQSSAALVRKERDAT